jgi:6,7-dimethyl-8-ribityllumazine synthase
MGKDFRGTGSGGRARPDGEGRRVGIAVARWNEAVTGRLLRGARDRLAECGVKDKHVDLAWVPGAFELPLAVQAMAETGRYDAVIALGCVIRGDTAHFEYVAGPAAEGLLRVQLRTRVPVAFGVLTTENRRQALVRSVVDGDVSGDNKGAEAVDTALEMAALLRRIRKG